MKQYLQKFSFLVLGLSLALAASYLNAWTGPTQTAPSGNVAAPVNLSGISQIKSGGLGVASLLSTGSIGASQYCDASGGNCATPPLVSGSGSSVPAGAVMAFNLNICPGGWVPSDGTNGTVDLRGVFVRGMESFNGGATASTTADPDRTGSATLGSYQSDQFLSHTHAYNNNRSNWMGHGNGAAFTYSIPGADSLTTSAGGTETRPKNRALLYCQKT